MFVNASEIPAATPFDAPSVMPTTAALVHEKVGLVSVAEVGV